MVAFCERCRGFGGSFLNITRETRKQNKILRIIKKNIVKNCLEMLAETANENDDYKKFSEQFGKSFKPCDCDEGYELMLQGNDSACVAKECGTFSRACPVEPLRMLFGDVGVVTCLSGFTVSSGVMCGVDADFVPVGSLPVGSPRSCGVPTVHFGLRPEGFGQQEKSAALSQVRADLDGATRELSFTNQYFDKLKPDCMGWSSASGSKRQRHNCNQQLMPRQAAQKRKSVVIERGERKERKERERRKNRGDRNQKTRKKERRNEGEQVEREQKDEERVKERRVEKGEEALNAEMLHRQVVLPIIRQRLTERCVLLVRHILRLSHPDFCSQ